MNPRAEIPDLPTFTEYLARDDDGTWWAYSGKPRKTAHFWWSELGGTEDRIFPSERFISMYQGLHWADTLIRISDLTNPCHEAPRPSTTREERVAERFELITGTALAPDQIWVLRQLMEDEA